MILKPSLSKILMACFLLIPIWIVYAWSKWDEGQFMNEIVYKMRSYPKTISMISNVKWQYKEWGRNCASSRFKERSIPTALPRVPLTVSIVRPQCPRSDSHLMIMSLFPRLCRRKYNETGIKEGPFQIPSFMEREMSKYAPRPPVAHFKKV